MFSAESGRNYMPAGKRKKQLPPRVETHTAASHDEVPLPRTREEKDEYEERHSGAYASAITKVQQAGALPMAPVRAQIGQGIRPKRTMPVIFIVLIIAGAGLGSVLAYTYDAQLNVSTTVNQYVYPIIPTFVLPGLTITATNGSSGSQIFNSAFTMTTRGEAVNFIFTAKGTVHFIGNNTDGALNRVYSLFRITIQNSTGNFTQIDALTSASSVRQLRLPDSTPYTVIIEYAVLPGVNLGSLQGVNVTAWLLIGRQ